MSKPMIGELGSFTLVAGKWTCPKCKSTNVYIRAGYMVDYFACKDCGYDSH